MIPISNCLISWTSRSCPDRSETHIGSHRNDATKTSNKSLAKHHEKRLLYWLRRTTAALPPLIRRARRMRLAPSLLYLAQHRSKQTSLKQPKICPQWSLNGIYKHPYPLDLSPRIPISSRPRHFTRRIKSTIVTSLACQRPTLIQSHG